MPRYNGDPRWLTAKYASTCACGKCINPGDEIMWFPRQRVAECETCGLMTQAHIEDDNLNQVLHVR